MELNCPQPHAISESIQLGHGSGGTLTHQLLEGVVYPALGNPLLETRHDGAVMRVGASRIAFTTDSYVVKPRFFPGGDIGSLAVFGTVNDLAMCGARPLHLSVGLIIEEGLAVAELRKVVQSIKEAAEGASVSVVTGDTKVVDRGHGDGLYINTSGIGICEHNRVIAPSSVCPGDVILLSGDIGRHGIAVLAQREGLEFETAIESDCASLHQSTLSLLDSGIEVHCLRDLTRGGLATALKDITESSGCGVELCESEVPLSEAVRGACELLGLDPLYVACEGRYVVILPAEHGDQALEIMNRFPESCHAVRCGTIVEKGGVRLESVLGTKRILDRLPGEQLPRIC